MKTAPNAHRDEGGFVLPWLALMLIVLVAMAGFGVDVWNWWYSAQKVQRAADAGALAGVPLMPDLNAATAKAQQLVVQNGFSNATAAQGAKQNQLVVTVSTNVSNYFTSLLGVSTTKISRSATAEYNAPIQMGSPVGHLGNDPENGATDQHWLNIGAPGVDKQTGDRFADYANCNTVSAYQCPSGTNLEYLDGTYVYTVDIPTVPSGGVDIQAYDPEYADGNANAQCDNQWLSGAQLTTLQNQNGGATYPDATTRYAGGRTNYCPGDDNTNLGSTAQATAWLVRDSSVSQFQALQNPVVSTGGPSASGTGPCAHQFKGYVPNSGTYWFDLLDTTNANGQYDSDFAKAFHRYYTLCHVTTPGRYFIQVRASVPFSAAQQNNPTYLSKSETPPEDTSIGGQNRYSVRVANTGTNTVTPGSAAYAVTRLPVYTNTTGSFTPSFYLARMLPGGGTAGRILVLEFYDIGDVSGGTTTLTVQPPAGSSATCSQWTFNGNNANPPPSGSTISGCSMSGITPNNYPNGNNGVLVDVRIQVPGSYTCNVSDPNACWFKIQMSYTNGTQANDTTTWGASIGGDPVRLVK